MKIGGLQKVSLIDYPGHIAAVIFTQGCDFRCTYCHNPDLVYPDQYKDVLNERDVLSFLKTRIDKLEGIVITGGEPTIQEDLIDFIIAIKDMGYQIKLDTNGSNPKVLEKLLDMHLLDFIAMDIKAPLDKYSDICGVFVNTDDIIQSINIVESSNISYQFRTTHDKSLISNEDLDEIKETLLKNKDLLIQECRVL